MDIKVVGLEGMDCINLAEGEDWCWAVVATLRVRMSNSVNSVSVDFLRVTLLHRVGVL